MRARILEWLARKWPWVAVPVIVVAGAAVALVVVEDAGPLTVRTIRVGSNPQSIAVGEGSVWVAGPGGVSVSEIDPDTNRIVGSPVPLFEQPTGVAVGRSHVWVGAVTGSTLNRIDAEKHEVVDSIEVGRTPQAVAIGFGKVWVGAINEGTVVMVDLESAERIGAPIRTGFEFPSAIATGFGSVWVTDVAEDVVVRLDPNDGSVLGEISVGNSPTAIAAGTDEVWVADFSGRVHRIDPQTNRVAGDAIPLGGGSLGGIAVGEDAVWVTLFEDDRLARIDAESKELTTLIKVGDAPAGVAAGEGSVWVANQGNGTVTRVEL